MNNNILITSISSKIPLIKTVSQSRDKFDKSIKIFGIDISSDILGKYFVDSFYKIKKNIDITIEELIDFCINHKIKYIIPTRDEDVLFYSFYMKEFIKNNIYVFSPSYEAVKLCHDKFYFVNSNNVDFNIRTSLDIMELSKIERFVVKERFGSGSKSLGLNLSFEDAKEFGKKLEEPIFQQYINGQEFSIDSYVNQNNQFVGCIIRKRELVQNGESVITFSVEDKLLEKKIKHFLVSNSIIGHSITQVIKTEKEYFLIECNTRFGGASPLSYKMGLKSFYWFLCEVNNKKFKFVRNSKNYKQVRVAKDFYFEC